MKNHIKVNGRLLQTNKTWSHLKEKQREAISSILQKGYQQLWMKNKRIPTKLEVDELLSNVYNEIEKRNIWIPFNEVKTYLSKKKHKWNTQNQTKLETVNNIENEEM